MARTPSVEVYADRDLIAKVEQYRDEHDLSNSSEAWRELVRRGLQSVEVQTNG